MSPNLTPRPQARKCNSLLRSNIRKLERDIQNSKQSEYKAKTFIIQADKRAQREPARAAQAQKEVREFAKTLLQQRKATSRLITAKAQLSSVQMQVNEAFAVRKIEGSIKASVGIMKDVNSLIKLPELSMTMRNLSEELMKAGIVEEMVDDVLPEDGEIEEEAEGEVDKVLGEILKDKKEPSLPAAPVPAPEVPAAEEPEEEDPEAMMDQMRNRLDALRS